MFLVLRGKIALRKKLGREDGSQHGSLGLPAHQEVVRHRLRHQNNPTDGQPAHGPIDWPGHIHEPFELLQGAAQEAEEIAVEKIKSIEIKCKYNSTQELIATILSCLSNMLFYDK